MIECGSLTYLFRPPISGPLRHDGKPFSLLSALAASIAAFSASKLSAPKYRDERRNVADFRRAGHERLQAAAGRVD